MGKVRHISIVERDGVAYYQTEAGCDGCEQEGIGNKDRRDAHRNMHP